ncbi:MAG: DNA-directed RNA polymerase subunit beta' [Oscillospiraceae bacterium]|jgi:DNA-directed RNA polymerase subunit beta'|nr:DNA-directed RNA polymerase subunit beta' [Oscillospiraceae bacterium]
MENIIFDSIKISLASPENILSWSSGEVTKPETINYRSLKPERGGLFCEKIFGPTKDWECSCGKYKRIRDRGKICEKCGVEITRAKVRRERMGHIELAAPVSHIWYFKGVPSRMALILDISPRDLEKVLYFVKHIVIDPGDTPLLPHQVLDPKELEDYRERYGQDFTAKMGAEAIEELLTAIDLDALSVQLREEMETTSGQKRAKALKRLEVVEAFRNSGNRPEWMILKVLPVLPPELRPMVQLDGGRFATSDMNDLYRRVINRNNRLKKMLELGAPDVIVRNEKRMLQDAVDSLINNGRHGRAMTGANNRALKSLSDLLKGKQGRFRQNLLGKRVDYSGRSVIVVGPELKIYQCGLPKEMALELFKPFVMKRLVEVFSPDAIERPVANGEKVTHRVGAENIKQARKMVERMDQQVWDALEVVIKDHPVLLNRAPTLHRLGIQAFEPVLVEGRAIKLHPLVCTAFNADFDGDQMAVHVPLSAEAQAEARFLMLAANNLLKPSDGRPVVVPTQDMVLGSYYLTMIKDGAVGEDKVFSSVSEAQLAYDAGDLELHTKVKIRFIGSLSGKRKGEKISRIVETTLGRVIFNENIPQDLGFCDRSDPANALVPEIDFLVNKKKLGEIIDRCIKIHGTSVTAEVLDNIKSQGFRYSTRAGLTVAVSDAVIPEDKAEYVKFAEERIAVIARDFERGKLTQEARSKAVIDTWEDCTHQVADSLKKSFDPFNPIHMMMDSGARGNDSQLRQLAGMRGLIANTAGRTIEVPIRANYREGLNILEYFISSRGARKGLADTALRTADSGYLTRRLVDVSQDVIIRELDCGCKDGIEVYDIIDNGRKIVTLAERLTGRYLMTDLLDSDGKLIQAKDEMMRDEDAKCVAEFAANEHQKAVQAGNAEEDSLPRVTIRSLLTCESHHGVCIKCYGANLATGAPVTVGEAVGIIAAQSIGEPGTQLTMRTFHTGGAKDAADITEGLPRVEELFEARKPKTLAILAEIPGLVRFEEIRKAQHVVITDPETGDEKAYLIPYGFRLRVKEGQTIQKGETLTEGAMNPHDILAVLGVNAVHDYLIREVQRTYRMQGVDINDKHIEVIVRQMMRKIKISDPGSANFLPGALIDKRELALANAEIVTRIEAGEDDLRTADAMPTLMGITKASLATDSFLSAASFQETTRVLTEAAIYGKVDPLLGLKENVIIGKLLPSGTGMQCYSDVEIHDMRDDYGKVTESLYAGVEI